MLKSLSIFTGNSNRALADEICKFVEIPLGRADVTHFSDGEIYVEVGENVRGVNCFVVQPTCSPPNQALMELLIMIDALKRASAGSIVAIIPYFGYARQDRKAKPRTPITAKLVANLITAAGADRALAMDLHAGQIQGFFDIPFDHLYAMPVLIDELRVLGFGGEQTVVCRPTPAASSAPARSPSGSAPGLAIIDKRRPAPNVSEIMNIVGDVRGKKAVIVDDIIDTAGTLTNAAHAIINAGAASVSACASHAVFSGKAVQRIEDSPLQHVVVTNTIPLSEVGAGVHQGPGQERRSPARRGDQAHPPRRLDQQLVRLGTRRCENNVMEVGKLTVSLRGRSGKGAVAQASRAGQGPGRLLRRLGRGRIEPLPITVDVKALRAALDPVRKRNTVIKPHDRGRRRAARAARAGQGHTRSTRCAATSPTSTCSRSIRTRRSAPRCRWSSTASPRARSTAASSASCCAA